MDAMYSTITAYCAARQAAMEQLLEQLVCINSRSYHPDGVQQVEDLVAVELAGLGFEITTIPGSPVSFPGPDREKPRLQLAGNHLLAQRRSAPDHPRLLLVGHADTALDAYGFAREVRDGRPVALGTGGADMKGGLVVMAGMLGALAECGLLDQCNLSVVVVSDEEVGSLDSCSLVEKTAPGHDLALVFESLPADGVYLQERLGVGMYHLAVYGRSAHAGRGHRQGVNAIREIARKVELIEQLTDYDRGVRLNVGLIEGGSAKNTVPGFAKCVIDLRYGDAATGVDIDLKLHDITLENTVTSVDDGTFAESLLAGGLTRPPKPFTKKEADLFTGLSRVSEQLYGRKLSWTKSSGGSDGNIVQAAGVPVLDSFGVCGGNIHRPDEFVYLDSLSVIAALDAAFVARWLHAK